MGQLSPHATTTGPGSTVHVPQQESPPQWEATLHNERVAPTRHNERAAPARHNERAAPARHNERAAPARHN